MEVLQAFIAALALIYFAFVRPSRYRCPGSLYAEGVRPSGVTRCVVPPPGRGQNECIHRHGDCDFEDRAFSFPVAVYCTGGAHPIVVDSQTVGCQR